MHLCGICSPTPPPPGIIVNPLTSPVFPLTEQPSQRVKFILGDESAADEEHQSHEVFTELEELHTAEDGDELEWKETARWIKNGGVLKIWVTLENNSQQSTLLRYSKRDVNGQSLLQYNR